MPAGSKPGERRGGRVAGTPNNNRALFDAHTAAIKHNCNPFEVMALAANGTMPCCVCFGSGRTKYKLDGEIHERLCESCFGTLREAVRPETRVKAASELAQYLASKRKQIDYTTSDGSMRPIWVVNVAPEVPGVAAPPHAVRVERKQHVIEATSSPIDDDVQ